MKKRNDPGEEAFLKVLRPLVETHRAVMRKDDQHVRKLGLTQAQFDVIVVLGETPGMPCNKITEETLLTKGTLTGVLDRLTIKGLIERVPSEIDRRSTIVRLTTQGADCFERVFPAHIAYLKPFFERGLTPSEMQSLRALLLKLKKSFEKEDKK
ncbi:MAG: MarR family transcriptional regulator [Nitrospirota bacterium]|nr:MarR family transcriptional regulator [Nitrospirota bacterium]